jgi:hypothetical protein
LKDLTRRQEELGEIGIWRNASFSTREMILALIIFFTSAARISEKIKPNN